MSTAELSELSRIRLERDLTYQELADEIGIDASALHRLLQDASRKPHERTLFKIRKYLERQPAAAPRRKRASA